jgi:hypothetical protein
MTEPPLFEIAILLPVRVDFESTTAPPLLRTLRFAVEFESITARSIIIVLLELDCG